MMSFDHPFAVGKYGLGVLYDSSRRQPTVVHAEVHGTACQGDPNTDSSGRLHLDVDRLLETRRVEIMVIRSRGAARQQ